MANIDHAPSRTMLNLLHVLPAFAEEATLRLHAIVELNSNTINKYELITETGQLKLDRVGYSSLAYPFAYGCIPRTWDEDGDPLDIEIVGVSELIHSSAITGRRKPNTTGSTTRISKSPAPAASTGSSMPRRPFASSRSARHAICL